MSAVSAARLAYIGLGSNLGASYDILVQAIAALVQIPNCALLKQSGFWQSAPVDAQGPDYINAVVALSIQMEPLDLLHQLQSIETQFDRKRPYPNAPRTLDLDLLWMEGVSMQSLELTLPHPRLHQRAFVVFPLGQIAPDLSIPSLGKIADWQLQTQNQRIKQITEQINKQSL